MQSGVTDGQMETKLRELHNTLTQYEGERNKNAETINNIQKTYEQMQVELKRMSFYKGNLKNMYNVALQDTEKEIELIKKALQLIQEVQDIRYSTVASKKSEKPREVRSKSALMKLILQSGISLPLWAGRSTESPPPLCGAIPAEPNYIAQVGHMVAALVTVSENEDWILAEVTGYNQITKQYKVDDIDEETRTEYIIGNDKVIPLPLFRANPETNPCAVFPKGTLVLALYPQSTCFYKAIIDEPPTKAHEPYTVLFEDSAYRTGYSPPKSIHQRYVLHYIDNNISDE